MFEGNPYEGGKLNTRGVDLLSFKQLPLYTSSNDYISLFVCVIVDYCIYDYSIDFIRAFSMERG